MRDTEKMRGSHFDLGLVRSPEGYSATLIISVYKNLKNLECILGALSKQTIKCFEIIISEDGDSIEMKEFLKPFLHLNTSLKHLSQEDNGFRKNRALNTAIRNASAQTLIFIDGDCVPHRRFIESHLRESEENIICSGRRLELGPALTRWAVRSSLVIRLLSNRLTFFFLLPLIVLDRGKNPESGVYSTVLQRTQKNKNASIVGCNFSCSKSALIHINGFDESYRAPGIGEDSDIEWRLKQAGYSVRSIKFLAILFHLYHQRTYQLSDENRQRYNLLLQSKQVRCLNGLSER